MFVSIRLVDSYPIYDSAKHYNSFILEDTEFSTKIEGEIESKIYMERGEASLIPSGLIAVYRHKKKNVPKNVALFYLSFFDNMVPEEERLRLFNCDFDWTARFFAELESEKYRHCIWNQIKVISYTGKTKYEKPVA